MERTWWKQEISLMAELGERLLFDDFHVFCRIGNEFRHFLPPIGSPLADKVFHIRVICCRGEES